MQAAIVIKDEVVSTQAERMDMMDMQHKDGLASLAQTISELNTQLKTAEERSLTAEARASQAERFLTANQVRTVPHGSSYCQTCIGSDFPSIFSKNKVEW